MPPAPTSPNRIASAMAGTVGQQAMLSMQRACQVIDMLLLVAFVPRQYEHLLQQPKCSRKPCRGVIDRFRTRQGEGISARAECLLIADDLTLKGRLLDVARRRGDAPVLEPLPERHRSARDFVGVHQ